MSYDLINSSVLIIYKSVNIKCPIYISRTQTANKDNGPLDNNQSHRHNIQPQYNNPIGATCRQTFNP